MELLDTTSTLCQNQISWNENGTPVGILQKYSQFDEKYSKRLFIFEFFVTILNSSR